MTAYAILTALAAIFSLGLAIYAFRHRQVGGALQLALLMMATFTWSFFYSLELLAKTLPAQITFAKLSYFGIVTAAPAWALFGVTYVGQRRRAQPSFYFLIWSIPAITLFLVLTNEQHHLIWQAYQGIHGPDYIVPRSTYGWWFWIHAAYSYLLLLFGSIPLIRQGVRTLRTNPKQAIVLLIGILPAWLINFIYLIGKEPVPGLDLTVFGLLCSGLILIIGIFRYRMLDIIPIAAETILDTITDGIMVVNVNRKTILQVNKAISQLLNISPEQLPGISLSAICPQAARALQQQRPIIQIGQRWFQVTTAPIKMAPDLQLLYLRDITRSRQDAENLRQQNRFLDGLNQITRTILSSQDETRTLQTLARQTAAMLQTPHVIIVDNESSSFQVLAATIPLEEAQQALIGLPLNVFQGPTPQIITQAESCIQSLLLLPLQAEKQTLGALVIGYPHAYTFSKQDIARGGQVADQIALALSKIRLLREMQNLAIRDDLTNAYNHRFLNFAGQKLFLECQQTGRPFSLLLFDLDAFKQINDRYGHLIGDLVLSQIARRAQSRLEEQDALVRYGGDEFIVLMPNTTLNAALERARLLKEHISHPPIKIPNAEIRPGVSVGLATLTPEVENLEALIRRADTALYQGKRKGKNCIVVYGEET